MAESFLVEYKSPNLYLRRRPIHLYLFPFSWSSLLGYISIVLQNILRNRKFNHYYYNNDKGYGKGYSYLIFKSIRFFTIYCI